jgi:hypothetical protein
LFVFEPVDCVGWKRACPGTKSFLGEIAGYLWIHHSDATGRSQQSVGFGQRGWGRSVCGGAVDANQVKQFTGIAKLFQRCLVYHHATIKAGLSKGFPGGADVLAWFGDGDYLHARFASQFVG